MAKKIPYCIWSVHIIYMYWNVTLHPRYVSYYINQKLNYLRRWKC
jgi:hypothetical protein